MDRTASLPLRSRSEQFPNAYPGTPNAELPLSRGCPGGSTHCTVVKCCRSQPRSPAAPGTRFSAGRLLLACVKKMQCKIRRPESMRQKFRGLGGVVVCKIIERQALRSVLFWWTPWVRGRLPASARVGWSTAVGVALHLPLHRRSAPPPRPLAAPPPPGVCGVWWSSRCARVGGLSSAVLASSPPVGARCGSLRSPPCSPAPPLAACV